MPYGSLNGFREIGTHSRARDDCHVSTFSGQGVTQSKCLVMIKIILDILPPFCARFRIFDEFVTSILFRPRFEVIKT